MLSDIFRWGMLVIIMIISLRKLFEINLPTKYKVLLFASGTTYLLISTVSSHYECNIGRHSVLLEGYIQNGQYFVGGAGRMGMQISAWNYQINLILEICTLMSLMINTIVYVFVFWEN